MPDRPAPAPRGPDGLPRRPPARRPRLHGLPGVQGAGYRLRHGGPGHSLPRARDPERVRGVVPLDRSGLLWVLRPGGHRQHRVARRADSCRRRLGDRGLAALSHLQRGGPRFPPGVDGTRSVGAGHPHTRPAGRAGWCPTGDPRVTRGAHDRRRGAGARGGGGVPACRRGRREGDRRLPRDLRAATVLRGAARRAPLHRGARHHGPHLRDLPRRLPDVRLRRDGGGLRRGGRRGDRRAPAAPLLRGVDPEPRAARLPAARSRLPRLRRRGGAGGARPAIGRARAHAQASRQPRDGDRGGEGGPSGQRQGGGLLPGTRRGSRGRPRRPPPARPRGRARHRGVGLGIRVPRRVRRLPVRRPPGPGAVPDRAGTPGFLGGPRRDARPSSPISWSKSTSSGPRRSTLGSAGGTPTSPGPSPGTRSTPGSCRPWPRRRPPAPASGPSAPTRSAASSSGRWSWCSRATRRSRWSRATDAPTGLRCR